MKLSIQKSSLELSINDKNNSQIQVIFSFERKLLKNALTITKNSSINSFDNLVEAGAISTITNEKYNIVVVSLGKKEDFNHTKLHTSLNSLANWLIKKQISGCDIILEEDIAVLLKIQTKEYTEQSIFYLISNMYYFDQFKSIKKVRELNRINFIIKNGDNATLANGIALIEGFFLIKDLGNTPANVATPSYLANTAQNMTKLSKKVQSKILDKKELKNLGMNCFLAVSHGSNEEPKLITLTYKGGSAKEKPIVLIGKGVTFDCGGISIKPRINMEQMKYDMMGAATVLGVFQTAVKLELPINLVIVAPCTENLISGSAVKPGDIVTTMSGKTVEILNTDAEGRLILCDALTYVKKLKPELVIDMATLTGACITALGHVASALYSNDDNLSEALKLASKRTNDKVWPMPLFDEYGEKLKSSVADLCNISNWNSIGGSIVAAKFLSYFVDYKWAHLDIAGTSHIGGNYDGNTANGGATGRPFNLIIDFLRNYCCQ